MTEPRNQTSAAGALHGLLRMLNWIGPILGLLLIYGIFTWLLPQTFTRWNNVFTILRQTAIVGIASLGMTMIIISGGIDLSVGSIVALTTVVIATLLNAGVAPHAALALGIGGGALCGLISGSIITRLRVSPFIVTLAMMLAVSGAAKGLAHETKVNAPVTWLNALMAAPRPPWDWMLVVPGVWLTLGLALLVAGLLRFTRLGRHTYAIGSNEQTARLCGVAVERAKTWIYTLGGLLAGVAGAMQFSRLTIGDPAVAKGLELDVIAAVVIGGGSLSGGEGSVVGTLVGALIMTTIRAGCMQLGLSNWIQEIITGGIIVTAVALDRLRHRSRA